MNTDQVEQVHCPSCGAPLELEAARAIVTCPYCGSQAKVVRRLRTVEPELPLEKTPAEKGDPATAYQRWSTAALLAGIAESENDEEKLSMARALDSWSHVRQATLPYVPFIMQSMLEANEELDKALAGIIGKLVCAKDIEFRRLVIQYARDYLFRLPGSKGLVFALSLGDAGTVKLLLDLAEWADARLATEYAEAALVGVQTAIGREKSRRTVCVEILIHRFLQVSPFIQGWIVRFLRNHFDVGYQDVHGQVVALVEDCAIEAPNLVSKLEKALRKCGSARTGAAFQQRVAQLRRLKTIDGRRVACLVLGRPPLGTAHAVLEEALQALEAIAVVDDEACAAAASTALQKLSAVS